MCLRRLAAGYALAQLSLQPVCGAEEDFDRPSGSRDGRWLLAQDLPPVVPQRACRGLHGRCNLLRLVGEGGGVQLECRLDQRDELCGWGQHPPVDLADGVSDGQVGPGFRRWS